MRTSRSWDRRSRSGTGTLDDTIANEFGEFDRILQRRGVIGISDMVANGSDAVKQNAANWIAREQRAQLYPTLISLGTDPSLRVRMTAVLNLQKVPPIALQPHLASLQAMHASESNTGLQAVMFELVTEVQNA